LGGGDARGSGGGSSNTGGSAAAAAAPLAAAGDSLTPQLLEGLLTRVLYGMRSGTVDGSDLSMALWSLAVLLLLRPALRQQLQLHPHTTHTRLPSLHSLQPPLSSPPSSSTASSPATSAGSRETAAATAAAAVQPRVVAVSVSEWLEAWWQAASDPRVIGTFSATCISQSLWAASQLKLLLQLDESMTSSSKSNQDLPMYGNSNSNDSNDDNAGSCSSSGASGVGGGGAGDANGSSSGHAVHAVHLGHAGVPPAPLLAALLSRMTEVKRSASAAELSTLIAALADLQYRPSDAWMTLFAAEARRRLGSPTAANEDHGLIAYGLAVLGWPLEEDWIKDLAACGYLRMPATSGEGLALLLWGLSQYGWSTDSRRFWNTVLRETGSKWDSCSARGAVLLYCAVADMLPPDMEPPLQWQRQLAKALRLRLPRPPHAALIPAALRAAAGGCLGPSPLRLRSAAAVAATTAATPAAGDGGGGGGGGSGELYGSSGGGGGGSGAVSSGGAQRQRSKGSALEASLRASAAAAREEGRGGVGGLYGNETDEEEDEMYGRRTDGYEGDYYDGEEEAEEEEEDAGPEQPEEWDEE
ncbi:hypothetical protein Agub_g10617, partial [Astrephomene gubernaculifera]